MKKAFTLVELLVVIAIISILTIITVAQFQTAKRKASDVARKGDLNAVSKALGMYFADYGEFPASANGLIDPNADDSGIAWGGEFADAGGYIYMKVLPKENKSGWTEFCYKTSDDNKKFGLYAKLENQEDSDCRWEDSAKTMGVYTCNGQKYCYAVVSPNARVYPLDPDL